MKTPSPRSLAPCRSSQPSPLPPALVCRAGAAARGRRRRRLAAAAAARRRVAAAAGSGGGGWRGDYGGGYRGYYDGGYRGYYGGGFGGGLRLLGQRLLRPGLLRHGIGIAPSVTRRYYRALLRAVLRRLLRRSEARRRADLQHGRAGRAARRPAGAAGGAPAEPIFYPRNGQSAEATESDRRECNRWATTQRGAMDDASIFQRATFACMEGRGYTVR